MKIWGYILVFLNVVATGTFVYLNMMVTKQKREWTAAAFKSDFVPKGVSLEKAEEPEDLDKDSSVAFDFKLFGLDHERVDQLPKDVLKKLIPSGGTTFWAAAGAEVVTNQTDEVERVRKKFDNEVSGRLAKGPGEVRPFLRQYLINLARSGAERDGINALLRDYPDPDWRSTARRELWYLGRTALQQDALRAITDLAFLDNDLEFQKKANILAGRKVIAIWAEKIADYIPPAVLQDAKGVRNETALAQQKEEQKTIQAALKALLIEMAADTPDEAKIAAGKARLRESLPAQVTPAGREYMEFLVNVAGNPLRKRDDPDAKDNDKHDSLADARAQLLALAISAAGTDSEKTAIVGIADLVMPPPLDANLKPEDREKELQRRTDEGPIAVAKALMKNYFDVAGAATSKSKDEKPLRDPGEKAAAVAHLLYHLDAHLFAKPSDRKPWHERVVAIIGYEAYVKAAEEQATRLKDMVPRLETFVREEQTAFNAEYQLLVEYSLYLALRLEEVEQQYTEQKALRAQQQTITEARNAEKLDLQNELGRERAKTKAALDALQTRTQELFNITKQLGEAQDALVGLEEKLRELELSFVKP